MCVGASADRVVARRLDAGSLPGDDVQAARRGAEFQAREINSYLGAGTGVDAIRTSRRRIFMLCSKYHPPMPLVVKQFPLAGAMIVVDPAPMMLSLPAPPKFLSVTAAASAGANVDGDTVYTEVKRNCRIDGFLDGQERAAGGVGRAGVAVAAVGADVVGGGGLKLRLGANFGQRPRYGSRPIHALSRASNGDRARRAPVGCGDVGRAVERRAIDRARGGERGRAAGDAAARDHVVRAGHGCAGHAGGQLDEAGERDLLDGRARCARPLR